MLAHPALPEAISPTQPAYFVFRAVEVGSVAAFAPFPSAEGLPTRPSIFPEARSKSTQPFLSKIPRERGVVLTLPSGFFDLPVLERPTSIFLLPLGSREERRVPRLEMRLFGLLLPHFGLLRVTPCRAVLYKSLVHFAIGGDGAGYEGSIAPLGSFYCLQLHSFSSPLLGPLAAFFRPLFPFLVVSFLNTRLGYRNVYLSSSCVSTVS